MSKEGGTPTEESVPDKCVLLGSGHVVSHLLGNAANRGSQTISQAPYDSASCAVAFLGFPPSLLPRVVELPNGVFAINANRPRLSEVVWALYCDHHTVHMLIVGAREVRRAGEGKDEFIRIRALGRRFEDSDSTKTTLDSPASAAVLGS